MTRSGVGLPTRCARTLFMALSTVMLKQACQVTHLSGHDPTDPSLIYWPDKEIRSAIGT